MDAGNPENLMECKSMTNIVFNNDICHETGIDSVFEKLDIQEVRFTAESCVDNSVKDPKTFIETNVVGSLNPAENTCALDAQVYATSQETIYPPHHHTHNALISLPDQAALIWSAKPDRASFAALSSCLWHKSHLIKLFRQLRIETVFRRTHHDHYPETPGRRTSFGLWKRTKRKRLVLFSGSLQNN